MAKSCNSSSNLLKCCLFSSSPVQGKEDRERDRRWRKREGEEVITKSTAMLNCLIEFTADALKLAVI